MKVLPTVLQHLTLQRITTCVPSAVRLCACALVFTSFEAELPALGLCSEKLWKSPCLAPPCTSSLLEADDVDQK